MHALRRRWLPLVPLLLAAMALPLAACKPEGIKTPPPAYTTGYYLLPDETSRYDFTVTRGTILNLTVKITNIADVPIELRLAEDNQSDTPDSLEPQVSSAWTTIQPGEEALFAAVYYIPENIPLGTYHLGITGKLREPVPDRAEQTPGFTLTVVEDTSPADQGAAQ